jgi:hypothetical protein
MIGLAWTSGYSILIYAATGILTIGGALALLTQTGQKVLAWFRPAQPLISFGHPEESPVPFVAWIDGSDAEWKAQMRAHEELRVKTLSVNYLIENKGTTNADTVRELSTGVRSIDGIESHTFEPCFVQILGPGEKVEVKGMDVPWEMHGGMTDTNRAEGFTYWAHFRDAKNRRWEATYNARTRKLDYHRL